MRPALPRGSRPRARLRQPLGAANQANQPSLPATARRYGHLTWEWAAGLRSYAHPLLFAAPLAALRALGLDSAWAVARVPLLLQALAAAATDAYVAKLAALAGGPQVAG